MRFSLSFGLTALVVAGCNNDIAIQEQANVAPAVAIDSPVDGANFFSDAAIELVGNVQDGNGIEDVALVTWTSSVDGPLGFDGEAEVNAEGVTSVTTFLAVGTHIITLSATDEEGLSAEETITVIIDPAQQEPDVEITSPTDFELYYPWESAVLSAAVSDYQDAPEDLITRWYGGPQNGTGTLIVQQNAHSSGTTTTTWNPGSLGNFMVRIEVEDSDGNISEDTTVVTFAEDRGPDWDDDGDCFCEGPECSGSSATDCPSIEPGDCEDSQPLVNPDGDDVPDMLYTDGNCDTVDGDLNNSVFLDPVSGLNSNDGRSMSTPVRTLDEAYSVAAADGVPWILLAAGDVVLAGDFQPGVNLAGGYDPSDWDRSGLITPSIAVPASGKTLSGWTVATTWQQLSIYGADASGTGSSAYALILDGSAGLVWESVQVESGDAANGRSGSSGSSGGNGGNGGQGVPGCEDSILACASCSRPGAGSAGSSPVNGGGSGGRPGHEGGWGDTGGRGSGPGGAGGSGGRGGGSGNGGIGTAGADGSDGGDGSAGASTGTWAGATYTPSNGTNGIDGTNGTGGGGGGGGGGGDDNCDSYGGSGGGGGGAGQRGTKGTAGTGGGASVAVILQASSVDMRGGIIATGAGGDGGAGGAGGNGGTGGNGGPQNAYGGSGEQDDGGNGGPGGRGGHGGDGGDGGGGGGGPVIGILCDGSTVTTDGNESFRVGAPGTGGSSAVPGANGATHDKLNCP